MATRRQKYRGKTPRRKSNLASPTNPTRARAQIRETAALEMRIAGATFDRIAEVLKFADRSVAYNTVKRALEKHKKDASLLAEEHRTESVERLRRVVATIYPYCIAEVSELPEPEPVKGRKAAPPRRIVPTWKAIDRLVRVEERLANLLGLDMPKMLQHSGPDGGPVRVEDVAESLSRILARRARSATGRGPDSGSSGTSGAS